MKQKKKMKERKRKKEAEKNKDKKIFTVGGTASKQPQMTFVTLDNNGFSGFCPTPCLM